MPFQIVLVGNVPELSNLLRTIGKPLGCEFSTFSKSQEAEQRLQSQKVDGVIVRLGMPYMSELELIRRVRASTLNGEVPIVLTTELDDVDTIREGFNAGGTIFLGQPLTPERVYGLLKVLRGPMLGGRRRLVRLPFRTTVDCVAGVFRDIHFAANSLNIGESGMLLEPSGGLDVGAELNLAFRIPGVKRPVRLQARIVRKEPPNRMGVEFTELGETDRDAVQSYLTGAFKDWA